MYSVYVQYVCMYVFMYLCMHIRAIRSQASSCVARAQCPNGRLLLLAGHNHILQTRILRLTLGPVSNGGSVFIWDEATQHLLPVQSGIHVMRRQGWTLGGLGLKAWSSLKDRTARTSGVKYTSRRGVLHPHECCNWRFLAVLLQSKLFVGNLSSTLHCYRACWYSCCRTHRSPVRAATEQPEQ